MGLHNLEAMILRELRTLPGLSKLRQKDIMVWSTSEVKAHEGETLVRLDDLGVNVAYLTPKPKGEASR